MQVKIFCNEIESVMNEWLAKNIGRGNGPEDKGKQVKFVTQSENIWDGQTEQTICVWYE